MGVIIINNIYISISIIFSAIILLKLNNIVFKKLLSKKHKIHIKFLHSAITVVIYTGTILGIFSQFEATQKFITSIAASSSIIVAVIIFVAQASLNDIISGIMLSWSKPFDIGERVQIIGLDITGIVENITVRHTVIRTFNNTQIIIPNSVLNKQIIENSDNRSISGNFLDVTISYESNLDKAIKIMEEQVKSNELVLITEDTPVDVSIRNLGENGVELRIQIWTKGVGENFQACSNLRKSILEEFKKNQIEVTYKHVKII